MSDYLSTTAPVITSDPTFLPHSLDAKTGLFKIRREAASTIERAREIGGPGRECRM
jgi:hypothetical protein